MKDKEYIKQIRYKEDKKLPMTDEEKADLEAFYQSIIDEENKYLIPATQRAEERNRQLDKRIEEMEKFLARKQAFVNYLASVAKKIKEEREALDKEEARLTKV
jgi:hypothetical protein